MTDPASHLVRTFDGKHEITVTIDLIMLTKITDETLAFWWHLAQHNPANGFKDPRPGEIAMKIGWEIIRRWLAKAPVEMYHHQQSHYTWNIARDLGTWKGEPRKFVPHEPVAADLDTVLEALGDAVDRARLLDPVKMVRMEKARDALLKGRQAQAEEAAQEQQGAGEAGGDA